MKFENISFWFDFFKDKRFSFRFKLANLIMNDYLRNYLAVGCLAKLGNFKHIEPKTLNEKTMCKWAESAYDTVVEIFEI